MLVRFLNRVKYDKKYYFGEMDIEDEDLANTFISMELAESLEDDDSDYEGERKVTEYDIKAMNRHELRTLCKEWGIHTDVSIKVVELHEILLKALELRKNGGNG